MKYKFLIAAFLFTLSFSVQSFAQTTPDPKEIITEADARMRGVSSSQGTMKMTIVRPTWTREMTMKSWSKGQDYSLILVTAPARDKGAAFLKREREMWNWQPSIDRIIKLPPSMMSQGWMGSDLTNDDLVKQASIIVDYTHKIIGEEEIEGRQTWKIELTPLEDAAVVWGKVIMWVSHKDYLQLKTEFYDEDDYLVNTIYGKNIKEMGGKVLTSLMEVIPAEEEGHKTTIEYLDLVFDKKIDDNFFSTQNMKRVR
jgi:outer membrane lipoprotein-sorting protein